MCASWLHSIVVWPLGTSSSAFRGPWWRWVGGGGSATYAASGPSRKGTAQREGRVSPETPKGARGCEVPRGLSRKGCRGGVAQPLFRREGTVGHLKLRSDQAPARHACLSQDTRPPPVHSPENRGSFTPRVSRLSSTPRGAFNGVARGGTGAGPATAGCSSAVGEGACESGALRTARCSCTNWREVCQGEIKKRHGILGAVRPRCFHSDVDVGLTLTHTHPHSPALAPAARAVRVRHLRRGSASPYARWPCSTLLRWRR